MFFDQNSKGKPLKRRQLLNLLIAGEIDLKASLARQPRSTAFAAYSPALCRIRPHQPYCSQCGGRK